MIAISSLEFIYLSPILVLGGLVVLLLFLILLFRINTKISATITISGLVLALLLSTFISYQITSNEISEKAEFNKSETTVANAEAGSDVDIQIQDETTTEEDEQEIVDDNTAIISHDLNTIGEHDMSSSAEDHYSKWRASYVTALFTSDAYGLMYCSFILLISIIVSALAFQWFTKEVAVHHGVFYLILVFSTLGGVILTYASHLISLYIGIELLSIPLVGLIGYQYSQAHTIEAAIKYMVLSAVATTFLLMGIAFYYAATGELTFSGLSFQLSILSQPSSLLLMGVCLMLVGIGFKLSLVPFQLWLPDVYQGAPAMVSLLLTTVGKVAIFCATARLFLLAPVVNNEVIRIILVVMAFGSIMWGSLLAMVQRNVKRLLAYSSIAHFGYLLIALIAVQYQVLALETIGIYLIGYMLANICILGVISLESQSTHQQDHESEMDLKGLFWRRPIMALSMAIGLLSLAGAPLTVGFIARFSLVLLSVTAELWWLVGAIVVGSSIGLYFYTKLIINLYVRPTRNEQSRNVINKIQFSIKQIGVCEIFIVMSALLSIIFGMFPRALFVMVNAAQYLTP